MRLDRFGSGGFQRGRPAWIEAVWLMVQALLVASWLPGSVHRCWLLRRFGAEVGYGVVIKPGVRVKFPWRLKIGDHVWIGEGVWIDNLAEIEIGEHSVISQGAYLCTGNHDWSREEFDLSVRPIAIEDQCWVGAFAKLAPGARMKQGSIVTLGSVATGTLAEWTIFRGNPAAAVKHRRRHDGPTRDGCGTMARTHDTDDGEPA